jgi:hypothetical protein
MDYRIPAETSTSRGPAFISLDETCTLLFRGDRGLTRTFPEVMVSILPLSVMKNWYCCTKQGDRLVTKQIQGPQKRFRLLINVRSQFIAGNCKVKHELPAVAILRYSHLGVS